MPKHETLDPEIELMTRAAALYYLEDITQSEIARQLGLSRPKVGRLLKRAREIGIVDIRVHTHSALSMELEKQLQQRFRLQHVLLVDTQNNQDIQRFQIARRVASFLERSLQHNSVVAVGMGRNTSAIPDGIAVVPTQIQCKFVSALGGSPLVSEPINPNDICRRLAEVFGAESESLYAPAYVATPEMRDVLLSHEQVQHTLSQARQADVALVGIGDAHDDSAVVQIGCFTVAAMRQLREAGAVGDIFGSFFNIDGDVIANGMQDRVVGLSLEDLRRIPCVVAIVSESDKALAILGALRSGTVNVLATSTDNAQRVLELDKREGTGITVRHGSNQSLY